MKTALTGREQKCRSPSARFGWRDTRAYKQPTAEPGGLSVIDSTAAHVIIMPWVVHAKSLDGWSRRALIPLPPADSAALSCAC